MKSKIIDFLFRLIPKKYVWIVSFEHIYYDSGGDETTTMAVFYSEKSANKYKQTFIEKANTEGQVYGARYYIHVSKHCIGEL